MFKDILGYEGLYQINEFGEVLSYPKKENGYKYKVLKPQKHPHGYLKVSLSKNCKVEQFLIHRLVAESFISNPNNYDLVNHKDSNKKNNCVENLEWCTSLQNVCHSIKSGTMSLRHLPKMGRENGYKVRKLNFEQAEEIRGLYSSGRFSISELSRKFKVSWDIISRVVKGKTYKDAGCQG